MEKKSFDFKKYIEGAFLLLMIGITLAYFIHSVGFSTFHDQMEYPDKETIVSLNEGWTCRTEERVFKDLNMPVKLPVDKGETCTMTLRLPKELPWDAALCFRSSEQSVRVTVNGETVYLYDTVANQPFGKSSPAAWNFVLVGQESAGGIVAISLTSPYARDSGLLPEVRLGSRGALLAQTTQDHIVEYIISSALFFLGLLMIIFSIHLIFVGYDYKRLLALGFFVLVAAVYLRVESHVPNVFKLDYFDENWLSFAALLLMPPAYLLYAKCDARRRYLPIYTVLFWLFCVTAGLRVILQMTGFLDFEQTQLITLIPVVISVFVVCLELIEKVRLERPPHFMFHGIGLAVLILSITAELCAYSFYLYRGLLHGGTLFSFGLLIYVICTIFSTIVLWIANNRRVAALDKQLADNRLALLAGQMQPHFLSNTLLAIQDLCYTDPEKAAATIVKFSAYLRTSIDVLGKEEGIPFAKEYQHICNFMDIEILRFGTDLQFETDIRVTDFSVPPLSIQPLVENAVHHGIRKKSGRGKVRLTTLREKDKIIVCIADDGVGFEAAVDRERSLANIRLRLAAVGATLTIKSSLNIGTEIVITMGGNHALHDR